MHASSHRILLRLGAAAAAAVTVLPALPAAADDAAPPSTRSVAIACPAERVTGTEFADAVGNVHEDAITCLNWYGIAQGTADGTYGAGVAVTRAQLATFLVRVLDEAGIELPEGEEDAFSDDDGNAHESNLNALAALGILNGAGDGTVSPNEPVHRDQMAALLVRIVELIDDEQIAESLEDYFDDDDDSVHNDAINALAGLGLAAGKADGVFDPTADVLREQMATFLMRLVDRLVAEGDVRLPAGLRLSAEEVSPGDVVQGVVIGENIAQVELVGCTFDGIVTDSDAAAEGVQFSLTVPASFPAETEDGSTDDETTSDETTSEETTEDETSTDVAAGTADGSEPAEGSDECEFSVVVTFDDGSVQVLEAELELADAEDGTEDGESTDDDNDGSSEDDTTV